MTVELVEHNYSLALCSLLAQRKFKVKQFMRKVKNAKFILKIVKFMLSLCPTADKSNRFKILRCKIFSEAFSASF